MPSELRASEAALIEIVLEGGPLLGFGHAGRCLALWEELAGRATFRAAGDADLSGFLRRHGARVGEGGDAPVVVLDRAECVSETEVNALHGEGRRVVLIDDLGPARMHADVVVDPPTAAHWPAAAGLRLGGFEHALLRREVREAGVAQRKPGAGTQGGGVLLAMGGSDPAALTPLLAHELGAAAIATTVALGPGYRGLFPTGASVLSSPEHFVVALAQAELFVGGYGHSLLEAAHLGVPAIAVVYKPEHLPHARAFCAHGTAQMFDLTTRSHAGELAVAVAELMSEPLRRAEMSARGRGLIDGLGAARVAGALLEQA